MWTADIDVGGTLTDGFSSAVKNVVCVEVNTTPHDLNVCLFGSGRKHPGIRRYLRALTADQPVPLVHDYHVKRL